MSESDELILARITITRFLTDNDVVDRVCADAGDGQDLGLADALGMLTLAQHTLVESYSRVEDDGDGE